MSTENEGGVRTFAAICSFAVAGASLASASGAWCF